MRKLAKMAEDVVFNAILNYCLLKTKHSLKYFIYFHDGLQQFKHRYFFSNFVCK